MADRPELFASDTVMEITDEETWKQLVDDAPGRVMVEFFVTWCSHCQREAPILDETAQAIRDGGVELYHANAEVMWKKGTVYDLRETPSFILVEDGKMIAKHEGFLTSDELIDFSQGRINDLPQSVDRSLSTSVHKRIHELAGE